MTPPSPLRLAAEAARVGLRAAPVTAVAMVVLTLLAGAVPATAAWFGKLLLDELSGDGDLVVLYAVAGAATVAAGAVCAQVLEVLAHRLKLLTTALLNARLFARANRLVGLRQFEDPRYQDRLRLAQDGATEAPASVLAFVTGTVRGLVTVGAYLGIVLALWWPLVVFVTVSVACALWAQARLTRLYAEAAAAVASSHRRRAMYQLVMLSARAAKEIRLYGLDTFFHTWMMRALRQGNAAELTVIHRAAVTQTVFAVAGGAIAAVGTVVVARRVLQGTSTIGDVAFLTAAVVGLQDGLSGIIDSVGRVRFSLRLFGTFLDIERSTDDLPAGARRSRRCAGRSSCATSGSGTATGRGSSAASR